MDYMCATLASEPRTISPTKFHNSVHNAAAGYWTIGSGCMHASTAVSAFDASFAQGLVEALAQLAEGAEAVLLAAYDGPATGPLETMSHSQIGRAHVRTPVTNAHLVCRLLLEKKQITKHTKLR